MIWYGRTLPRIVTPPPPGSHLSLIAHIIIILGPMHETQDEERDAEEDAIHDAKRETRLLHRAILFDAGREAARPGDAIGAHNHVRGAVAADAGAVGAGDAAEFVDAGDEGADEAEVDKGDEESGSLG